MATDEREYFGWDAWNEGSSQTHFSELSYRHELVQTEHTHDFYEIFAVLRGSTGHRYAGKEELLEAGQVLFIRPSDRHCFCNPSGEKERCDFINIEISRSFFQRVADYLDDAPLFERLLSVPEPPTMKLKDMYFDQLVACIRNLGVHYFDEHQVDTRVRSILPQIFIWYGDYFSKQQQHLPTWFAALCDEMKKPENFIKGVECLEELSGKSHGYLCHCFQKYLNTSPTGFLNAARMGYCAYQLRHTRRDILDVMFSAGFESPSHFYRLFQKEYKMSPAKYRKRSGFEGQMTVAGKK